MALLDLAGRRSLVFLQVVVLTQFGNILIIFSFLKFIH